METGIRNLDSILGDVEDRSILIAGVPGAGKTHLLSNIACSMSRSHSVLWMTASSDEVERARESCMTCLGQERNPVLNSSMISAPSMVSLASSLSTDETSTTGEQDNDSATAGNDGSSIGNIIFSPMLRSSARWPEIWGGRNIEVAIFDDADDCYPDRFPMGLIPRARTVFLGCRVNRSRVQTADINDRMLLGIHSSYASDVDMIVGIYPDSTNTIRMQLVKSRDGFVSNVESRILSFNAANELQRRQPSPVDIQKVLSDLGIKEEFDEEEAISKAIDDLMRDMDPPDFSSGQVADCGLM